MLNYKRLLLLLSFCLMHVFNYAQQINYSKEEPTDFMRSNGKIFVVMGVAVVIMLGLFIYLINLDRKIKKLEKDNMGQS